MRAAIGRAQAPMTRVSLCVLVSLCLNAASLAQTPDDPLVQSEEPGVIVTQMLVTASEAEVRALLDDPYAFAAFTPDVQHMDVQSRGLCKLLRFRSRGFIAPFTYSTQRCPSSTGWSEHLLESDDFTRYDADIQLASVTGGTHITYKLSVGLDIPVPDIVISKNVKRSARLTMQALRDLLLRPSDSPEATETPQVPGTESPPLH